MTKIKWIYRHHNLANFITIAWVLSILKIQLYKIVKIDEYRIDKFKTGMYGIGKYKYL